MLLEQIDFSYGTDGDYVKVGVQCSIEEVVGLVAKYTSEVEKLLSDKFSVHFQMDGISDTSIKKILESTLATAYPSLKVRLNAEVKGHALKNFIGHQLNKFDESKYKYYYQKDRWKMTCIPFLLRGAKLDLKLNKLDMDSVLQSNPQMAPLKDMQIRALLQ